MRIFYAPNRKFCFLLKENFVISFSADLTDKCIDNTLNIYGNFEMNSELSAKF